MHVYFVRHGETEANRKHRHQSANTPLSVWGRNMMVTCAETLRSVNPDILITSEYTRAVESAEILGTNLGLKPISNELFYEIIRPSKFYTDSVFSFETIWYVIVSIMKRNDPSWRYADAENLHDIESRAEKALRYIESLHGKHQSVVIVSHSVFINVMVAYMCRSTTLDIRSLLHTFFDVGRMKNAAVVHLQYVGSDTPYTCAWKIHHDIV